ncbi:hypothetical protein BHM03_00054389 [Ensete ventricosum]|nr:hypothetical protein BHM03_00054389 [Ensete ventricosum]
MSSCVSSASFSIATTSVALVGAPCMAVTWEFVRSSDVKDGGGDQVEMGRDGFGVYDPGLPRLLQIPCHCNLTLAVTAAVCGARGTGSTTAQTPRRILALGFQRLVGSGQDARRASCVWHSAYVAFAFNARGCDKDTGNTSMYKYMYVLYNTHTHVNEILGTDEFLPFCVNNSSCTWLFPPKDGKVKAGGHHVGARVGWSQMLGGIRMETGPIVSPAVDPFREAIGPGELTQSDPGEDGSHIRDLSQPASRKLTN